MRSTTAAHCLARRRLVLLALAAACLVVPAARAQDFESAKMGVGHEIYLTFKPEQLAGPNGEKMEIEYINKGVVQANIVSKTRLRLVAQKRGKCGVKIKAVGGARKTFLIDVLDPRDLLDEKHNRKPLELGAGHDRMLRLPADFAKGTGEPVVTAGNPDVLRFDIVNKHIRLIGKDEGISDLSLLSANDELIGYRVTVRGSTDPIQGDPGKNPLQTRRGTQPYAHIARQPGRAGRKADSAHRHGRPAGGNRQRGLAAVDVHHRQRRRRF